VLAYHGVNLAPRAQLAELERIGHRFAGQGPALMTEYQPYGVRHFLRAVDAEGASELRRRQIPLRSGAMLEKGAYADLAEFQQSAVGIYRTLILRRSPLASRPPTIYQLVWRGRFYDVWRRTHESVGAGARRCDASRALSSLSRSRSGSAETVLALSRVDHPATWPAAADGQLVYPTGPGVVRAQIGLSATGRYSVWIGGSFRNRLVALVDGREIGAQTDQLNNSGQYTRLGTATLAAGVHDVELRYSRSVFRPGSGGPEYGFGPLAVSRDEARC
jgi:hypothetical protein